MAIFNYVGEISGGRTPMLVKTAFKEQKDLKKGTPVFRHFNKNGVVTTNSLGIFAGIVAEDYSYQADELGLNPKSAKGEVSVNVSRDSVYTVKPGAIITSTGSDGYITHFDIAMGEKPPVGVKGAHFILAEKGEGSTNPFEIGKVFALNQIMIYSDDVQYWFFEPTQCCAGDKFIFIPSYGFEGYTFDNAGNLIFDFVNKGNSLVLDSDFEKGTVTLKFNEIA